MAHPIPVRSVSDLLAEGEKLLKKRPRCNQTLNELTAAILIAKMHAQGFDVSLEDAEGCIRRMRIAVDTGIYPDELLRKAAVTSAPPSFAAA